MAYNSMICFLYVPCVYYVLPMCSLCVPCVHLCVLCVRARARTHVWVRAWCMVQLCLYVSLCLILCALMYTCMLIYVYRRVWMWLQAAALIFQRIERVRMCEWTRIVPPFFTYIFESQQMCPSTVCYSLNNSQRSEIQK